ncbi:MAG: hypothetical protein DWG83_01560 [Chloroflexi bacterium]|nr:hypothetical protein [Chloroflexota bacterium]
MSPLSDRARGRRHTSSFYERALDASDRDLLAEARDVEGLDDEVAMLRVHVHRLLEEQSADPRQLQAGIRLLVQALTARHRLTGREAQTLTETATDLFEQFIAAFSSGDSGDGGGR